MFASRSILNRSVLSAVAAAALLGAAAASSALPPASESGGGVSRMFMTHTDDDGKKIVVEIEKGKVTKATVDGKKVSADSVKTDGEEIVIVGEDGKEIVRVLRPGSGNRNVVARAWGQGDKGMFDVKMAEAMAKMHGAWAPDEIMLPTEAPKVMLGVLLGEVSGNLAEHFGIKSDEATLITCVSENAEMPAGKAGMKATDIVVAIDGKSPAGMKAFREAMSGKNPGDSVRFTVISGGQRKDVTVKLVAYDPEKLKNAFPKQEEKNDWVVVPTPPATPTPPAGQGFSGSLPRSAPLSPAQRNNLDEKLEKLSQRLERLETMLEKLMEKKP